MFSEKVTVKFSDLAPNKSASLAAMLRFFQNSAMDHSAAAGYPTEYLYSLGHAWILISMNIEVMRYPREHDELEIITYATGFDRCYGYRSYIAKDENGEEIARAASVWIFINTKTGHPVRALPDVAEKYKIDADMPHLEYIRREPKNAASCKCMDIVAGKRDLDTNYHVNNVRLAEFLEEALPLDTVVEKAGIFFRSAVYENDIIGVFSGENEGALDVALKDAEGKTHTSAKFFKKN
mgnify:FL=1